MFLQQNQEIGISRIENLCLGNKYLTKIFHLVNTKYVFGANIFKVKVSKTIFLLGNEMQYLLNQLFSMYFTTDVNT